MRPPATASLNPESMLVQLFEEATILARDESLLDAERGRRLVKLLGLPEAKMRRIRLTHQYGKWLADGILATEKRLGPYRFVRSRRPGDPAPGVREVFPA